MGTSDSKPQKKPTVRHYDGQYPRNFWDPHQSSYAPSAPSFSDFDNAHGPSPRTVTTRSKSPPRTTTYAYAQSSLSSNRTTLYPEVSSSLRKEETRHTQTARSESPPRSAASVYNQSRLSNNCTMLHPEVPSSVHKEETSHTQAKQPVPAPQSTPARDPLLNVDAFFVTQQNNVSSSSASDGRSNLYPQIPASLREEETKPSQAKDSGREPLSKDAYKKNDDCKFYYYTVCSKGDRCPFRHEPTARNSNIECNLWLKSKCNREHCGFRHMKLENNTTPCYWEIKEGCYITKCPFLHTKSKGVGGTTNKNMAMDMKEEKKTKPARGNRKRRELEPKFNYLGSNSNLPQSVEAENAGVRTLVREESTIHDLLKKLQIAEQMQKKEATADDDNASDMTSEPDYHRPRRNMRREKEDCKFYYYANCTRAKCYYRHDPAAKGCTEVCYDWREGKCNRAHCKYRHMELVNNPQSCWWEENEPSGCHIVNCPFQHKSEKTDEGRDVLVNSGSSADFSNKNEDPHPKVRHQSRGGGGGRRREWKPKPMGSSRDSSVQNERNERHASTVFSGLVVVEHAPGRIYDNGGSQDRSNDQERNEMTDNQTSTAKQEENHPKKNRRNRSGGRGRKNMPRNSSGDGGISEKVGEEAASASTDSENASAKILELQKQLEETRKKLEERDQAARDAMLEQQRMDAKVEETRTDFETKMKEELTCLICFELFVKAVTLNCSHTFCQFCIREWRAIERRCPACNNPITSETRALNIDNYIEGTITSLSTKAQVQRQEALQRRNNNQM